MFEFLTSLTNRVTDKHSKRTRTRKFYRPLRTEHLEDRRMLATVGVFQNDDPGEVGGSYDGYTLFAPSLTHRTYLIDNEGALVHAWPADYDPGNSVYMNPDGSIWRTGSVGLDQVWPWNANGVGGAIQKISWEGEVLHEIRIADRNANKNSRILHHDIEPLPNGNLLAIAFDFMSVKRARKNGRDPVLTQAADQGDRHLIPDSILEIKPTGKRNYEIVWEWHVEDHFVQDKFRNRLNYAGDGNTVADFPQKIDINYVHPNVGEQADFTHANGIHYNPDLDQIIMSVRSYSEFWVIDHNTTTAEAKGEKGDLLYRWGNPASYGAGDIDDQQLQFQHDALWVPSELPDEALPGSITVYNNGHARGPRRSSVENIIPPWNGTEYVLTPDPYGTGEDIMAWGPTLADKVDDGNIEWQTLAFFPDPSSADLMAGDNRHFSAIISGAHRQPNGNTLVTEGVTGTIFEVNPAGDVVWEYVSPVIPGGRVRQGNPVPLVEFFPPQLNVHQNFIFKARRYSFDYLESDIELRLGDKPGLYDRDTGTWYLNNDSNGSVDFLFELPGDPTDNTKIAISGDWDGDGTDNVGLYDQTNNTWHLWDNTDTELGDPIVVQGGPTDIPLRPIVGDWDGDGSDTVGLYDWRTNEWHLFNTIDEDPNIFQGDVTTFSGVNHGREALKPLAGDWDGDGIDTVGLFVPGTNRWYLNNGPGWEGTFIDFRGPRPKSSGRVPITGDWNGDGFDTVGLFVPGSNTWFLNNATDGSTDNMFAFSAPPVPRSWRPIVGNWNGSSLNDDAELPLAGGEGEFVLPAGFEAIDLADTEFGNAPVAAGVLDVNADGRVTPQDALIATNTINSSSISDTDLYADVNGDMLVSAIDTLLIVNHLNKQSQLAAAASSVFAVGQSVVAGSSASQSLAPEGESSIDLIDDGVDSWRIGDGDESSDPPAESNPLDEDSLDDVLNDLADDVAGVWAD